MSSGGRRPGSGRKPEDRVPVTMWVARTTKERMALLRHDGIRIGREVDDLIEQLCLDLELLSEEEI